MAGVVGCTRYLKRNLTEKNPVALNQEIVVAKLCFHHVPSSDLAVVMRGCPILLENKSSSHILLQLWHQVRINTSK
jgi:hypothetical protein